MSNNNGLSVLLSSAALASGNGKIEVADITAHFKVSFVKNEDGWTYRLLLENVNKSESHEWIKLERFTPVHMAMNAFIQYARFGAYRNSQAGFHLGERANTPDMPIGWIASYSDSEVVIRGTIYAVTNMPKDGWAPIFVMGKTAKAGREVSFEAVVAGTATTSDQNALWYHVALDEILKGNSLSLHIAKKSNGGGTEPLARKILQSWEEPDLEKARELANEARGESRREHSAYKDEQAIKAGKMIVSLEKFADEDGIVPGTFIPMEDGTRRSLDSVLKGTNVKVVAVKGGRVLYPYIWSARNADNEAFALRLISQGLFARF